jgi:glyoxylase-like metal-dependent hydrolase (beta-lactamase superfamily II)
MVLKTTKVGNIKTNCYILESKGEVAIIDPGGDAQKIIEKVESFHNSFVKYVLFTHGHFDHVLAADDLKIKYPQANFFIGEEDEILFKDLKDQGALVGMTFNNLRVRPMVLAEGSTLTFGEGEIVVMETPGHSPGGMTYLFENCAFTGDTLFYHTYGRTDLPGSNEALMVSSLRKLFALPPDTIVCPGHGMATTIAEEKRYNNGI